MSTVKAPPDPGTSLEGSVTPAKRLSNLGGSRYSAWLLTVLILIAAWYGMLRLVSSQFFPTPLETVQELWAIAVQEPMLWLNIWDSAVRILIGFIVGSVVGVAAGLAIGGSPRILAPVVGPYVYFFRFIPATAMIVVALIWFGTGEMSKIFIVFFGTVFFVALNTQSGVQSVLSDRVDGAKALGATEWQTFSMVVIPSTVPYVVTGMRIAMTNSVSVIVAAEMIVADSGIGYLIMHGRLFLNTDTMLVGILTLGVIGLTIDRSFQATTKRYAGAYTHGR